MPVQGAQPMTRTDVYMTVAVVAWLAGAYWIEDGLRVQAAATDRQAIATYCTSDIIGGRADDDSRQRNCAANWDAHAIKVKERDDPVGAKLEGRLKSLKERLSKP